MKCNWSDFYGNVEESIPGDMPVPRGNFVDTTCFVDASHASCLKTRCSQTGILLFVNKAPITWYSSRQNTVETSTFSSEFIVMKIAVEIIEALRYKVLLDNHLYSILRYSLIPNSTFLHSFSMFAFQS
jgi:hypothetical protein